ncbi:glycosyltransferase [bacterium]|nr:glycosyltransferase [bacterium]
MKQLKSYEDVAGHVAVSQLRQLADDLTGAKIVHVNSTRVGGGVAEILEWLIPLMQDLGLDASWEVVEGKDDYYKTTKDFHNGLQGKLVTLPPSKIAVYEETARKNAERLRPILEEADYVFIHDPQPAALLDLCPKRKGKWVWRCHIDVSHPIRKVWNYLKSKVSGYDASIYSMPDFAQSLDHPQFIIAPSIDPLSEKNCDIPSREIKATLERYGIPNNIPIITQVSRFDIFKDPLGVIEAFKMLTETMEAELVLAGGGATDDPEGAAVLEEVQEAAQGNPHIHVLLLPSDAHRTINALQRASTIVVQKSLQEGFGLTVTEAMWKGKPVIGGNAGGIRLQVFNHHTGFLVNSPEGAALKMRELLRRPERMNVMGATAKKFVRENFLLTRHLREYLTLMLGLRLGLSDRLMAD